MPQRIMVGLQVLFDVGSENLTFYRPGMVKITPLGFSCGNIHFRVLSGENYGAI